MKNSVLLFLAAMTFASAQVQAYSDEVNEKLNDCDTNNYSTKHERDVCRDHVLSPSPTETVTLDRANSDVDNRDANKGFNEMRQGAE
jgi:hypothetical protein